MEIKKRILVVDDEPDIMKTIKLSLELEEFEVIEAIDGKEGLKKTREEQPDLIILDLMLPKMDGYKVCHMLKFDKKYRYIPIIILTARAQKIDKVKAKESGADIYLTKPISSETLIKNINKLLK